MQLQDRTVLVTGASSGIGRELAFLLAERGCHVVLTGRHRARLDAVARATNGAAIVADLAAPESVAHLAATLRETHPNVSVVVNNAAIQLNYLLADLGPEQAVEDVAREVQIDLTAPIQLTALLLPLLQEEATRTARPSALVNVTTGLVLAPKKTAAVYCAAKAGLRTFTKALRFQLETARRDGGPDVRAVEAMMPLVDTPMTEGRGRGKIAPVEAARAIVQGLLRERDEIYVGKAQALRILHRLLPPVAERMFRNA